MSLILGTSFDSNYKFGPGWVESLKQHCNIPFLVIDADKVDTQMPRKIIQHGEFLDHIPKLEDHDVILFVDADCVLQRPFTDKEIAMMESLQFGQMMATPNITVGYTLISEMMAYGAIADHESAKTVLEMVREHRNCTCFNSGVLAARVDTWRTHRKWFERLWLPVDRAFFHYAKVQLLVSYVMHAKLEPLWFPVSFHQHGMMDENFNGVTFEGKTAFVGGEMVAIRHALFLDPPKDPKRDPASIVKWPEGARDHLVTTVKPNTVLMDGGAHSDPARTQP